jgi:hypothetical protein
MQYAAIQENLAHPTKSLWILPVGLSRSSSVLAGIAKLAFGIDQLENLLAEVGGEEKRKKKKKRRRKRERERRMPSHFD